MIDVFSQALCLSKAHVAVRYRGLREGGLVSKTGRGISGAAMTPLDASRLLISLMSAQPIAEATEAARILGQAVCVDSEGDADQVEDITDLTFEHAVALLLERSLAKRLASTPSSALRFNDLTIVVSATRLTATIIQGEFLTTYHPADCKGFSHDVAAAQTLSIGDRLMLRADRTGIEITTRIEGPELLELAPAFGPAGAVYLPTH